MARFARIIAGFGLILVGIVLLVIPGPGLLTILGGVALLASEFAWARGIADWAKEKSSFLQRKEQGPLPSDDEGDQIG